MGLRILIPRPRWQRSLGRLHKFVWVALGVAAWGTAYTLLGASGLVGVVRARSEAEQLEQQVRASRAGNERLEDWIRDLKADPETVEELARERLYLAKPGEKVYLLPPAPDDSTPPPGDDEPREAWPTAEGRRR